MPNAKIFLVSEEGKLKPMVETRYENEAILQVLMASYPDLLPGDQIDPEAPRRWMLVKRELTVPGEAGSAWSLDHLFLDQDGIPTFVECKRSSDTRARREVVAQMLDYAANGIKYWTMDEIRQAASETAHKHHRVLDEEIANLVGGEEERSIDDFWKTVEKNLRSGRVRLIFVADSTTPELRRLVEFLNEKMRDVEVLAVEVKQFLDEEGHKAMVPRVVGLTQAAIQDKGSQRGKTDRVKLLAESTPEASRFFEMMLDSAQARGDTIYWGERGFSIRVYSPKMKSYLSFMYGSPPNRFEFYFGHLQLPPEVEKSVREKLLAYKIVKAGGKKTLRAEITAETYATMCQVHDTAVEQIKSVLEKYLT
jgi:ribosomal protein L7Ae-like RNA K-turn-binding protein